MSESIPAVFLSYASQDAEAAKRICEALRAAGVEVWFDQNELTGGDEWDQKIRGQVKSCALFMPIVSAATQARREGYFRLEWKLADDRTHLMARGTPFLVPVCIDETKDWDAIVPDSFMNVQWTRLPGGETSLKFCERVQALLRGEVAVPSRPRPTPPAASAVAVPEAKPAKRMPRWPLAVGAALLVGAGLFFVLRSKPAAAPAIPTPAVAASPTAPATNAMAPVWPHDSDLRRAIALVNGTEANTEDFALAEDIAKKALAKNSTDPEAVTVMARVQVSYLYRGFDRSDDRRATARRYAERAVQLAPNDPEALGALGVFHFQQGSNSDLARELLNKAIQLRPDEPYYYRHRDNALFGDPRVPVAEALASAEKTAERFRRDALAQYELARHYRDLGRMDEAERAIDRTLAIEPIANAIAWKARFALNLRSDFAETKALLDRIPPRMRALERVVISRWIYAISGTDREDGIEALRSLTNSWIEDFYYVGPKSLLMAALLEASGKRESARLNYEAALTETRNRQAREPGNLRLHNVETCALLGLGRLDEARAANRVVMESVRRPYRYDPFETWWFSEIPRCLVLGDRETALQLLREAAVGEAATPSGRIATWSSHISVSTVLRTAMKQDPRMAPFRDDPEIVALLPEPKKEAAALPASVAFDEKSTPADKSVAVLAFANLSDDKANEYFSDGISEELLNVLTKVPGLKVTARTSSFHFKGKDTPIPEIARQLGVAYVIEGSVRKAGDKVRITAQLIKAADGFHVWSDTFTRDLKDIFAVQDEIAGLIAKNLSLTLGDASRPAKPVNPEAYSLYLEARQYVITLSIANLARGEKLFLRALEIDPGFTRAAAGLALLRATRAVNRCIASRHMEPELAEIERALAEMLRLDPGLGEAHAALAAVQSARDRSAEAEAEFRLANQLGFGREQASHVIGFSYFRRGRLDLGIATMEEARAVNPLAWTPFDLIGLGRMYGRRYFEAADAFRTATQKGGAPVVFANQALALVSLGRKAEAIASALAALNAPNREDWLEGFIAWSDGIAAWALAQAGARAEAEVVVRRLQNGPFASRYAAGFALAELGRTDEAAAALADIGSNISYLFFFLNEHSALCEDPRFRRLLTNLHAQDDFELFRQVVAQQEPKK